MASGILGTADLAATTNTTVYTVPASKTSSCSVSIRIEREGSNCSCCNRNSRYGRVHRIRHGRASQYTS